MAVDATRWELNFSPLPRFGGGGRKQLALHFQEDQTMPLSFGRPQVGLTAGGATGPGTPESNTPFRILILGDFKIGRAHV